MTVSEQRITKLPTLKKHSADVKYFAPLQILCGGADAINKEMGDENGKFISRRLS